MDITYYGANCLWIETKKLKILFDPEIEELGLKPPKKKPDVVIYSTITEEKRESDSDTFVIDMPGEYELKDVSIRGVAARLHIQKEEDVPRGVAYTISHDDINFTLFGNLQADFSEEQMDDIGDVHVISLPVGGHGLTIDKVAAAGLVSQLDAGIIIPTHYADKGVKYPVPQDELKAFLDEIGTDEPEHLDKLKLKFSDLPEETKVVVLKRQN